MKPCACICDVATTNKIRTSKKVLTQYVGVMILANRAFVPQFACEWGGEWYVCRKGGGMGGG